MSWNLGTNNTGDALAALDANSLRILWQKNIDVFEQTEDFFSTFEGANRTDPIWVTNDTSKGAGLKFRVTVRSGYYGPGKLGDNQFTQPTDFEVDNISSFELDADYLRNATSITRRSDEYMGMMGELRSGQVEELGKWMGREKTARAMMTYRLRGGSQNTVFANGKTSIGLLKSADSLSLNSILTMGQALKPLGGQPCKTAVVRGTDVLKYCVVGVTPGLFSLKQDPGYQLMLQQAMPRENYEQNPLYTGGYAEIDGHSIREYNPIDHDGNGPVGSAFNAKGFLGTAITAGTSAIAITGGGLAVGAPDTLKQYFRFFSNYAFPFLANDTFSPPTDEKYFLIVNPSNAPTDPGKSCMYAYTTGNNGNQITITKRLAPVQNGPVALLTVGNVTWSTGVWANLHTQTHPQGATIVQCNANGVPIGRTVMLAAGSMLRGYGMYRNNRTQWLVDGEHQTNTYITTVFGQVLRKNNRGVYPGYVQMEHAILYPELALPTVV
jgi:hypothetical protein